MQATRSTDGGRPTTLRHRLVRLALAGSVLSGVALAAVAGSAATPAQAAMLNPTTTSTTLMSNGGASGTDITVAPGALVTDTATITATGPAGAVPPPSSGAVDYTVWSAPNCSGFVADGGTVPVGTGGVADPSSPIGPLAIGKYYWSATFSGTAGYMASTSCNEIETVQSTTGAPPGPPSCATTATGGTGENTIMWCGPTNPGTAAVQCYQIYRSTGSGPATQIASVCSGQPGFSTLSYADTSVTCNTAYTYYVTSSNMYGASPPSNTASASATCGTPPPPPGSCSSYTGNPAFICALYVDLLGRVPAASEINSWLNQLNSGVSRTAVGLGIINSAEYETDLLNSFYEDCLGRPIDPAGLQHWLTAFEQGATVEQVEASILSSPEFYADSGSTNAGWVNGVYQCLLGRMADPSGLSTWTTALANGTSLFEVASLIASSPEAFTDAVESDYESLLGRSADPAGLAMWVGDLESGATDQQVLAGIAGSQEFYNDAPSA